MSARHRLTISTYKSIMLTTISPLSERFCECSTNCYKYWYMPVTDSITSGSSLVWSITIPCSTEVYAEIM